MYYRAVAGDTAPKAIAATKFVEDAFLRAGLPGANHDVSRDGTHILGLTPAEEAQVIVVYNWKEELRARMGRKARK